MAILGLPLAFHGLLVAAFSRPSTSGTMPVRAFSSEVDTGSREENALKQESRALVLIQSEPKML
jgi:hypothetical protein